MLNTVLSALHTLQNYLEGGYLYLPHLTKKVNEVQRGDVCGQAHTAGSVRSRTLVWPTEVHLLPPKGHRGEQGAGVGARLSQGADLALPPASATPPLPGPRLLVCEGRRFALQRRGPPILGFSQMLRMCLIVKSFVMLVLVWLICNKPQKSLQILLPSLTDWSLKHADSTA